MTDGLSVPLRLVGFLLLALLVFAAAWGLGRAVGPIDTEVDQHDDGHALVASPTTDHPEGAAR